MTSRRPTISDVARRAGVSKGAVSFALNGRPGRGAGDPGPDPRGRPRAGLDAEPPGPRPVGVPGAGRRPGHRPPAGDPRRGPVLPAFIAGIESALAPLRPGAASCRSCRTSTRELAGYRRLAARRPGRRRLPHRPAGRRPAARAARRDRAAGGPGSARTASAAPARASPSTTGPASPPRSRTSSSSATAHIAHVAGPDHVRARRLAGARPGPARCAAAGLPAGPCVAVRLLGRRAAPTPPRRCSTCRTRPPRSSTPTT